MIGKEKSPVPRTGWGLLSAAPGSGHRPDNKAIILGNSGGTKKETGKLRGDTVFNLAPGHAGIDLRAGWPHPQIMNMQAPTPFPRKHADDRVAFDRRELGAILGLYGRMVAAGEWRDYGMSFLKDVAVFSVFRRTAEHPIYRIEKRPKLRGRQGQYAVIGMDGRILKRGHDLGAVLRVFDRKFIRAVE